MMDMPPPIEYVCFVAGKSGGHSVPALTMARRIKEEAPQKKVLFFSTDSALDKSVISRSGTVDEHVTLPLSSVSFAWYRAPFDALKLMGSFFKSLWKLMRFRPQSVTSIGGLVSIPVVGAAWLLKIPVTLYELNAVPGRAVTFLSRFAQRINVCFDDVRGILPQKKTFKVDYPVRFSQSDILSKSTRRAQVRIPFDARVLLVLGGSQGSHFLNSFVQSYVRHHKDHAADSTLFVIHQAGSSDVNGLRDFYHQLKVPAHVFAFESDLAPYYSSADCAISRAGAGSIFELQFFGIKTLLIPLEASTTDHQLDNAYAIAQRRSDLFTVMRQGDCEDHSQAAFDLLDSCLGVGG